MKIAVLDLGTNTFNLLITEVYEDKSFIILHNDKVGVKLGKGGINNKVITPDAFQRAIDGIALHFEVIKRFEVHKVVAVATSGIRSSSNGTDLVNQLNRQFGIEIQIISGDEEAELIYRGIKQTVELNSSFDLLLDIGGGSNEFIIANKNGLHWKQSFDLGIARIIELFDPSDPIKPEEIKKVEKYFDSHLAPLYEMTQIFNPTTLIGSSGTFNTLRSMIIERKMLDNSLYVNHKSFTIELDDFYSFHSDIVKSSHNERLEMKGLEMVRIEMIVLASIFVNFIVQKLGIKTIVQSSFSLKEGLLDKIING